MNRLVPLLALAAAALAGCGAERPSSPAPPRLPAGIADGGGLRYVAAIDADTGATAVRALRTRDGRAVRAATLPGRWVLPRVGRDFAGSLSGDGGTLALAGPSGEGTSAFALLDTRLAAPPRTFTLRGRFEFDALSPDGAVVYLIEHRGAGVYWVRAYDVARGRLRSGAIVEKGETDPDMTGSPVAREVGPGGSPVYTLYRGGDHGAFVHALHTDVGVALCVDLPGAAAWRLQWRGARLYAVDGRRRVPVDA